MTEKLGEIGEVFSDIHRAVKVSKALRQKNSELMGVIEQTKKQADELEKLQIPDEPLLDELKRKVRKLRDSASQLETWFTNFGKEITSFENFVRTKIRGTSIPPAVVQDFCEALRRIHGMAQGFSDAFESFIKKLKGAQEAATLLTDKMKQTEAELQQRASSKAAWGTAGTVGLALAGAGLFALGFFTGGATWVAAGAAAGAAFGAGAVAVGVKTALDVRQMRQLAGEILQDANKLEGIAQHLKGISDKAGDIKLDKEALEALETALEFFNRDQEKDRRIAELEARLHSLGH